MINALINTYIQFWKNGLDFKGRTRRKDFLVAFFGSLLIAILGFLIITFFLPFLLFSEDYYPIAVASFFSIYPLMTLIPFLAISTRRLHDIGLSGWWLLPIVLLDIILELILSLGIILKLTLDYSFNSLTPAFGFLSLASDVLSFLIVIEGIVMFSFPSQPFTNRYGENPLEKSPLESKTTPSDENSK